MLFRGFKFSSKFFQSALYNSTNQKQCLKIIYTAEVHNLFGPRATVYYLVSPREEDQILSWTFESWVKKYI